MDQEYFDLFKDKDKPTLVEIEFNNNTFLKKLIFDFDEEKKQIKCSSALDVLNKDARDFNRYEFFNISEIKNIMKL